MAPSAVGTEPVLDCWDVNASCVDVVCSGCILLPHQPPALGQVHRRGGTTASPSCPLRKNKTIRVSYLVAPCIVNASCVDCLCSGCSPLPTRPLPRAGAPSWGTTASPFMSTAGRTK